MADRISSELGIEPSGNPSKWFSVLTRVNGYNGDMAICGETKSAVTGDKITGRFVRENVLNLRSACFSISYDDSAGEFEFITQGYGHGVAHYVQIIAVTDVSERLGAFFCILRVGAATSLNLK